VYAQVEGGGWGGKEKENIGRWQLQVIEYVLQNACCRIFPTEQILQSISKVEYILYRIHADIGRWLLKFVECTQKTPRYMQKVSDACTREINSCAKKKKIMYVCKGS